MRRLKIFFERGNNYFKAKVNAGFFSQIITTIIVRFVYISLIAEISKQNIVFSNLSILILTYSAVACSFISLSSPQFVFTYFRTEGASVIEACMYQLRILFIIGLFLLLLLFILLPYNIADNYFIIVASVLLIAVAMAQAEVIYAIASGLSSRLKGVSYQGTTLVFFIIYLFCIINKINLQLCIIYSSLAFFVSNFILYAVISKPYKLLSNTIKFHLKKRLALLFGALPELLFFPFLISMISAKQPEINLADVALFVSFFGALMFILSNYYNYFGIEINDLMSTKLEKNGVVAIFSIFLVLIFVTIVISVPMGFLFNLLTTYQVKIAPVNWMLSASLISSALLFNFWYISFSMKYRKAFLTVFLPNCLMFLAASIFFIYKIDYVYALLFCYLIRFTAQVKNVNNNLIH